MEIFHRSVSKGNGVKFVCDSLNIGHEYTLGIGNDFNDLDLLEFTNYSYIVDNGPDELKSQFFNTRSNEENAFMDNPTTDLFQIHVLSLTAAVNILHHGLQN